MATYGTYRVDDGSPVEFRQAVLTWADEAHRILAAAASTYGGLVTYGDLGEQVQRRTGIRTNMLPSNWVGKMLGIVVHRCAEAGEPPLTSLVVRQHDGEVGDGYDEVLLVAGLRPVANRNEREDHAAAARLACYRHFGADVPAGAVPMLSPRLAERRGLPPPVVPSLPRPGRAGAAPAGAATAARRPASPRPSGPPPRPADAGRRTPARRVAPDDVRRPVCPTCFLELPATGICQNCA